MSAGSVMTTVENERWAKNATLKRTISQATGTRVTRHIQGMRAAHTPNTTFREKSSECPWCKRRLDHQPPTKLPTPEAA